jgi:hypothetical protein
MLFDVKTEIDRINKAYMKTYMPATETDPECLTEAGDMRLSEIEADLRANPEKLLDADIDDLVAIYKAHSRNPEKLYQSMIDYFEGLIQEQAKESL